MITLEYTDEATFITEKVEFQDDLVNLAEEVHEYFGNYGPVIVRRDKQSLAFGVNLEHNDRLKRERGDRLYRIIIEKV